MPEQISREHHFVPRFLLRQWTVNDKLIGFHLTRKGTLRTRELGVGAFCKELDLLTIRAHGLPSDAVERWFGRIDDRGALVTKKLLEIGPNRLTADERSDFGRLLLSLEARYPENVARLKDEIPDRLKDLLDTDPEVLQAIVHAGEIRKASQLLEVHHPAYFASRALLLSQALVDNPRVGGRLINATWRVYHLRQTDGTLLFADRPLFRFKGYDDPACIWMLPLTPTAAFVAANDPHAIRNIDRATGRQFRKRANANTIAQVARYVFALDMSHEKFIQKYLPRATASGLPSVRDQPVASAVDDR